MAVKQALLRSNISITKIQKSVSSLGKGLNQAKESSSKMRLSLMDRNRFKRRQLQFEDNNFIEEDRQLREKMLKMLQKYQILVVLEDLLVI